MEKFVYLILTAIGRVRSVVGLIVPLFAEAADFRKWAPWVRVVFQLIVLGLFLYGLYLLNNNSRWIQDNLLSRAGPLLREFYLPLVGLLVVALNWIAYLAWKVWTRTDAPEYPDIAAAWDEGVKELEKAGIFVADCPLFLVVGRPADGDDALFLASHLKVAVRTPRDPAAPVRFYAARDPAGHASVYVTCSGASAWGKYAAVLANPSAAPKMLGESQADFGDRTIGPADNGVDKTLYDELNNLFRIRDVRKLSADEENRMYDIGKVINRAGGARPAHLPSEEVGRGNKRLAYVCRLAREARRPWCPFNGALVLVPWAALDAPEIAADAAPVLRADLVTVRTAAQLRFPNYVLVCDIENAVGFSNFRGGFPQGMLKQRIGQRLPLVPDVTPDQVPQLLTAAADWIRTNVLASWVVKFLVYEPPDQRKTANFVPSGNRRLFQFLVDLSARGPRLGLVLAQGLPTDATAGQLEDALPLCGGCYLAATGKEDHRQAFVAGVFQRLTESQSALSWTPQGAADDRTYRFWASVMWLAAMACVAAAGGIGYLHWKG